ncbi:hypothetical protein SBOR_7852 [Sclerotinia borealis F-4128]|uniref:Binding protein n=1 Tax=Sclerotinia borealis (strain F-4128) TaxID=1432307 RepID=W9CB17_SCLBF|nr:hypothetical protein SBOR_7852 [Sclerotinia borealis F-4128]
MFSKTIIATLLASTAAASPIVSARAAGDKFGLISIRSGTDLQNQAIVAYQGGLWIGKDTSSYCPLAEGCPAGTDTTFAAGDNTLSMNVEVPGGQQVYVATSAAVSFTPPHSGDTQGGVVTGWTYTAGQDGALGQMSLPGYGFIACASTDGPGIYQVYATLGGSGTGNCSGIAVATVPYTGAVSAWEYL